MPPGIPINPQLPHMAPVVQLLARIAANLPADFRPDRPVRVCRAPGRLDVMGGIADYTGSLVCELPLDCAAAAALQERDDRQLRVFSLNLLEERKPHFFEISLDELAHHTLETLRASLSSDDQRGAGYIVGCAWVLQESSLIDLRNPQTTGFNLAIYSTVPPDAGVGSSAAIEVATMMLLRDHFGLMNPAAGRSLRIANGSGQAHLGAFTPLKLAELCQSAENRVVGVPCGIMDPVASCLGEEGQLLRMICQPHELQKNLAIPSGMRFFGINSNVRHDIGGGAYARTRCAAFMAHRIMLEKMREIGASVGRTLVADPMRGYLANLDPDDYKRIFRPNLPEKMRGDAFLEKYEKTMDAATSVDPRIEYDIQHAADHHVLEARRVRNFARYIGEALAAPGPREKGGALDRAGHLMYASHQSYTMDAMLGAPECDLLVQLVRQRERAGLYGAKITGRGSGGTVAVLAETTQSVDAAIAEIMKEYETQTGRTPQLLAGSSQGAWHAGTAMCELAV